MRGRPSVSVIIPTYDRSGPLLEALKSALEQTLPPAEVIVVDDGSQEDIAGILRGHMNDERIRCIRQENAGPARARNRGIQAARGKFVAFLDSDDVWLPEKLEKQARALEREPRVSLSTCWVQFTDRSGRVSHTRDDYSQMPLVWRLLSVVTPAVFVRRDALGKGFDERYTYLEDKELWLRLGLSGGLVVVEEVLAVCRRVDSSMTVQLANRPQLLDQFDRDITLFWDDMRHCLGLRPEDLRHVRRKVAILRHDLGEYAAKQGYNQLARRNLFWAWRANPKRFSTLVMLVKVLLAPGLRGC